MSFSFIALNRVAENRAAEDADYRAELKRNGKVLLSEARALSDEELLAKLGGFGIALDQEALRTLAGEFLSAEGIYREVMKDRRRQPGQPVMSEDWVWFAFTLLWERWLPEIPSLEMFDERMQEGYRLQEQDAAAASDCWLGVWKDFFTILDRSGLRTIHEFDEQLRGTQFVSNWVQDVEMALGNTAVERPEYHRHRLQFCEQFLQRFSDHDPLMTENMRRALAESVWGSGGRARAERLFEGWLKEDPQWGWGWVGWSDLHGFPRRGTKPDWSKAEAILRRGLAVARVQDRDALMERLEGIYERTGRKIEAAAFGKSAVKARTTAELMGDDQLRLKTAFDFGEEGMPLDELPKLAAEMRNQHLDMLDKASKRKVGRNEPCPCGSGKKFKQCCGR